MKWQQSDYIILRLSMRPEEHNLTFPWFDAFLWYHTYQGWSGVSEEQQRQTHRQTDTQTQP